MSRKDGRPGGSQTETGDVVIKNKNHTGICGVNEKTGEISVIEATGGERAVLKTRFRNTRELDSDKWRSRVRPLV
jgi:hypothetical protein